jgi:hypothetical protein
MSTLAPVSSRPISPRADLDGREMTSRRPLAGNVAAGKNFVFINKTRHATLTLPTWSLARIARRKQQGGCVMTILPTADQIRTIVHRTFLELDIDEDALHDVDERIMLDDGRYVARSYRVDDFLAMWMIDVGLVQFYDADGNMLRTVNLFEEVAPHRMAA